MKRLTLLSLLAILFTINISFAELPIDWGQSGRTLFNGKTPMVLQWTRMFEYSKRTSVIASNGKQLLYVTSNATLVCIDPNTNKEIWRKEAKSRIGFAPNITNSLALITSNGGWINAFDLDRSEKRIDLSTGHDLMTTASIGNKNIFVRGLNTSKHNGGLVAIDLAKGKKSWSAGCGYSFQPPALSMSCVFVQTEDMSTIKCLDQTDGKVIWEKNLGEAIDFISVRSGAVVAINSFGAVFCLDRDTGEVKWQKPFVGQITNPATISPDSIFITTNNGSKLQCLSLETGDVVWRTDFNGAVRQPLFYRDDAGEKVIVTRTYSIDFLDCVTGRSLYNIDVPYEIVADVLPVGEHIFVPTSTDLLSYESAGNEIIVPQKMIELKASSLDPFTNQNIQIFNRTAKPQTVKTESFAKWLNVQPAVFEIPPQENANIMLSADLREYGFGQLEAKVTISWGMGSIDLQAIGAKTDDSKKKEPTKGCLKVDTELIELLGRQNDLVPAIELEALNIGEQPITFKVEGNRPWMMIGQKNTIIPGLTGVKISLCGIAQFASMGENLGEITITCDETNQIFTIPTRFTRDYGKDHIVVSIKLNSTVATIGNIKVRIRPAPYMSKTGYLMMPLDFIVLSFGFKYEKIRTTIDDEKITVYKYTRGDLTIFYKSGDDFFDKVLNGVASVVSIPTKPELIDDHFTVPVYTICELLGAQLIENENGCFTIDSFLPEVP